MGIVIFTTILTLSALYAPQPLLPVLAAEFAVSRESAAFLTTVAFLPLSIAPLVYGFILESMSPRRLLRIAVLLLALTEILFFLSPSFSLLIGVRLLQGVLIPAILTSLMTYVALVTRSAAVQRAMGIYIAATILGGFLGRACSGAIATWLGWRYSFLILAVSLLLCFFFLGRLAATATLSLTRPDPRIVLRILGRQGYLNVYLMVFCLFFVFAAMMNFLPFRLTEISKGASEFRIGMMYSGYLMGILTSLGAVRAVRIAGSEVKVMAIGLLLLALALLGLIADRPEVLFGIMFLFCGAMFLVHATASGFLNRRAADNKGMVNGLYVSFYYGGGALGSYLPGFIYERFGWTVFVYVLMGVATAGLLVVVSCRGGE
jgi:YNFM family putative membrane transporter